MIVQQTLTQLRALNLEGMATAFEEQVTLPSSSILAFEDRVALLVEREAAHRDGRRLTPKPALRIWTRAPAAAWMLG